MWGAARCRGTPCRSLRAGHAWKRECACMQEAYAAACREHGHEPGPVFLPDRDTPSVCFVADDVDNAWTKSASTSDDVQAYAAWNPDNATSAGFSKCGHRRRTAQGGANRTASTAWPKPSNACGAGEIINFRRCAAACPGYRVVLPETYRRGRHTGGSEVTGGSAVDVYYDPFDSRSMTIPIRLEADEG